jgi:hypothetical protein
LESENREKRKLERRLKKMKELGKATDEDDED